MSRSSCLKMVSGFPIVIVLYLWQLGYGFQCFNEKSAGFKRNRKKSCFWKKNSKIQQEHFHSFACKEDISTKRILLLRCTTLMSYSQRRFWDEWTGEFYFKAPLNLPLKTKQKRSWNVFKWTLMRTFSKYTHILRLSSLHYFFNLYST